MTVQGNHQQLLSSSNGNLDWEALFFKVFQFFILLGDVNMMLRNRSVYFYYP